MTMTIIGNCQAEVLSQCMRLMLQRDDIMTLNFGLLKAGTVKMNEVFATSEHVLVQTAHLQRVSNLLPLDDIEARRKIIAYPTIYFTAYHPDFVYPVGLRSAFGQPSSAIAVYGWLQGFSVAETVGLYRGEVFEALGYLDAWRPSAASLYVDGDKAGFDLRPRLQAWREPGCFVHAPNHPKLWVMADIARLVADRLGLRAIVRRPERLMPDPFASNVSWPVYSEVAAALGIEGEAWFKRSGAGSGALVGKHLFDIESFVTASFASYGKSDRASVRCAEVENPGYARLNDLRAGGLRRSTGGGSTNPYRGLPGHHFWRKSVAEPKPEDVDPVHRVKFRIEPETRIATAGSCFAQHVARHLQVSGFRYFVAEAGEGLPPDEAQRRNYGVFSARYGNLYTARQLVQLFDRAEGHFEPLDVTWSRGDRLIDPFRPEIEPDGFKSEAALLESREHHFAAVRRMWRELDVFVFTLGLTEAWRSKLDGAVFPLAPGVAGAPENFADYEFHNFTATEVTGDLMAFVERLRRVNPRARILLTVSPVPLVATYEDRHVLVSTTFSKSALRVAAETVSASDSMIDYFPSYEIITGNFNRGRYFAEDLRSVTEEGVGHVMRLFLRHLTQVEQHKEASSLIEASGKAAQEDGVLEAARAVICEEELLDSD